MMKKLIVSASIVLAVLLIVLQFSPHLTVAQDKPPRRGGGPKKKDDPKLGPVPPEIVKPSMADTIKANIYGDNSFILYINGRLTAVDSIEFVPHNVISVDILPEYPMTIAVMAQDYGDPKTGLEYGSHIGDGGFILKFADGTVTNGQWKAKKFSWGPINGDWQHPRVQRRVIPENWFAVDFDDSSWPQAKVYTEEEVNPKPPFYEYDFKGAQFIWSDDLALDNTVIFRYRVEKPGWKPRWNTKPTNPIPPAAEPEVVP